MLKISNKKNFDIEKNKNKSYTSISNTRSVQNPQMEELIRKHTQELTVIKNQLDALQIEFSSFKKLSTEHREHSELQRMAILEIAGKRTLQHPKSGENKEKDRKVMQDTTVISHLATYPLPTFSDIFDPPTPEPPFPFRDDGDALSHHSSHSNDTDETDDTLKESVSLPTLSEHLSPIEEIGTKVSITETDTPAKIFVPLRRSARIRSHSTLITLTHF